MSDPTLSVVIASWPDLAGLDDCLEALEPQQQAAIEIIVVSAVCPPPVTRDRYPWVTWIEGAPGGLIPHFWGQGMALAHGSVTAITTAHFVPPPDWIASITQAHARLKAPAVGGPIDPPRGGSAVDWATYFLRYSAYLNYNCEQSAHDLAGDNASYKRSALAASMLQCERDGFWEPDLHRRLRAANQELMFVPEIHVTQRRSFGFMPFLRQRFHHGRQFGQSRFRGRPAWVRLAAAVGAPLIPLVLLGKIVGRVARSRRDLGRFVFSLPILMCFLLAWSLGEASGYLLSSGPGEAK